MDAPVERLGRSPVQGNIVVKSSNLPHEWWAEGLYYHISATQGLPDAIKAEVINLKVPELYFYGSRSKTLIPVENRDSDWDFAFQNNQKSAEAVVAAGFTLKTTVYPYQDGNTFECYEKIVDGHKIQLVSKGNLELFKDVWSLISDDFWQTYMNKRSDKYMGKDGVTDLIKHFHRMVETGVHKPLGEML